MRALVAGASGYVGSRLVPALLAAGWQVRAGSRQPETLSRFDWYEQVEPVHLDCLDAGSVAAALPDVDVLYYLVHALGGGDFVAEDRSAAQVVSRVARDRGLPRIVYLGGFVPDGERLSEHLDSRAEVGEILRASGVPCVWLKAAVILGAGSASFELIRYLADRLPVIPRPSWTRTLVQPIAIDDVLYYLIAAAEHVPPGSWDIAADEVVPYRDLTDRYLRLTGRRRLAVPVWGVSAGVAAAMIGRLTPVPTGLAADLVHSLTNTMVATESRIRTVVPDPPGGLTGIDDAFRRALAPAGGPDVLALNESDPDWAGGDEYHAGAQRSIDAPAGTVWDLVNQIGGAQGWYSWPLAWRVRGWLDGLAGGPGLRVERRDLHVLTPGDIIDFFEVDAVDAVGPSRSVRFVMDRYNPGQGSLELTVEEVDDDRCTLSARATWRPDGIPGQLYWWVIRPFHAVIFPDLVDTIGRNAERLELLG